jgi:N utilization substance protein B
MISRRLVRIKTLQTLYSWKQSNIDDEYQFIENLKVSIYQSHAFYLFLLDFPYQLQQFLNEKLELERTLYFPDTKKIQLYSILNNTPLIQKIHQEVLLTDESIKFSWDEMEVHFETWFQNMLTWDFVKISCLELEHACSTGKIPCQHAAPFPDGERDDVVYWYLIQ